MVRGAIGGDFTESLCRAGAVQSSTPSRRGVEVNRGLLDVLTDNGTVTGGAEETGHLTACPWEEPVRHCAGLEHRERANRCRLVAESSTGGTRRRLQGLTIRRARGGAGALPTLQWSYARRCSAPALAHFRGGFGEPRSSGPGTRRNGSRRASSRPTRRAPQARVRGVARVASCAVARDGRNSTNIIPVYLGDGCWNL